MSDIDAINERTSNATPGPWRYYAPDKYCAFPQVIIGPSDLLFSGDEDRSEDAIFIAHARDDIPVLIAKVNALKTELEQARARVADLDAALSHWAGIANTARAEADALRARVKELNQQVLDRDGWISRYNLNSDMIGKALDCIRTKRATGEPARSDNEEVAALVRELLYLRARVKELEGQNRQSICCEGEGSNA